MKFSKIGIVGIGRLGTSLLKSLSKRHEVIAYDSDAPRIPRIKGVTIAVSAADLAEKSDAVIIAVKPGDFDATVAPVAPKLEGKLLISVAAAVSLPRIASLGVKQAIRVMPNICVEVNEGMIVYCLGSGAQKYEDAFVDAFSKLGMCLRVEEKHIDAITACSGSGPAFIAMFAEAIANETARHGVDEKTARIAIAQTLIGTGKLMLAGKSADEIIAQVASPGGVTEEGLKILEEHKISEKIGEAIRFAIRKTSQLPK